MAKTARQKLEKKVYDALSKYARLRDAVSRKEGWGYCCSCSKIVQIKYADGGHFIGRGKGGSSGVRFDERNVHLQCKQCNLSHETVCYKKYMLDRYGQKVIDELGRLHRTRNYTLMDLEGLLLYYKQAYEELADGD